MADDDCRDVKLAYINNVQTSLFETGRRIHGLVLIYFTVIGLTLFLSLDIITIAPQINFAGIVLSIPRPLLLLGGAILVGLLQFYIRAVSFHEKRLRGEISEVYESLGFTPKTKLLASEISTIGFADIYALAMDGLSGYVRKYVASRLVKTPSGTREYKGSFAEALLVVTVLFFVGLWAFALMVVVMFLPTVVQVLAVKEVVVTQHGMNWSIALVILVLVTIDSLGWISLTRHAYGVISNLVGLAIHASLFIRSVWRKRGSRNRQPVNRSA